VADVVEVAVLSYYPVRLQAFMTIAFLEPIRSSNLKVISVRTIGVFSGSTQKTMLREGRDDVSSLFSIESAVASLRKKRCLRLYVADALFLEYISSNNPNSAVEVCGPIFEPDKYGFALNPGNPSPSCDPTSCSEGKENDLIARNYAQIIRDDRRLKGEPWLPFAVELQKHGRSTPHHSRLICASIYAS